MFKKQLKIMAVGLFFPIVSILVAHNDFTDNEKALYDFVVTQYKNDHNTVVQDDIPLKKTFKQKFFDKFIPKKAREASSNKRKHVSNRERAEIVAKLIETENQINLTYPVINALELVKGQSDKSLVSVLNSLSKPQTMSGELTFVQTLLNPISDIEILKHRQNIIKTLISDEKLSKTIEQNLKKFKNTESSLYEFFSEDPMVTPVESKLVYSRFNVINNYSFLYNATTIIPATLTVSALPMLSFAALVGFYRTISNYIKPGIDILAKVKIQQEKRLDTPEELEKACEEIIKNMYTPCSQQEENELYEKLKKGTSEEIASARFKLKDNLIKKLAQRKINDEEISVYDCAVLSKDVIKLTSPKTILILEVIPTTFLGIRQISELSIIGKKAKEVQTYLSDITKIVEIAENVYRFVSNIEVLKQSTFGILLEQFIQNQELDRLKSFLKKSTFKGNPSIISNWGRIFATLKEMEKQKDHFVPLIKALGEIDMYVAVSNMVQQYAVSDVNKVGFCFAEFIENKNMPIINAVEFWNPFILSHKKINNVITNSIEFGVKGQHCILTGPNTCGKTTIIIALMLNTILAQAFGISAAKQFTLTPFDIFNATLTIGTDGAIGDSRFKAEIRQAQQVLDSVKQAQLDGKLCLTIQDEIFTGTNQEDGSVATYNFLQKLGEYKNNITLLATHYAKLTTLGAPYVNFKINAEVHNNNIIRHFTLSHGISNLNIAQLLTEQAGLV